MPPSATRSAAVCIAAAMLSGCAVQKVAFQTDQRQSIRTIAIASQADAELHYLTPRPNAGGFALYAFGAIGGAIAGSIEARRAQAASLELQEAMRSQTPSVGGRFNAELAEALRAKGYRVIQAPSVALKPAGEPLDCRAAADGADAVLVTQVRAGFVEGAAVEPRIALKVQLRKPDCATVLHADTYAYSAAQVLDEVLIRRPDDAIFPDRGRLMADPVRAKDLLESGAATLAARVAQDL